MMKWLILLIVFITVESNAQVKYLSKDTSYIVPRFVFRDMSEKVIKYGSIESRLIYSDRVISLQEERFGDLLKSDSLKNVLLYKKDKTIDYLNLRNRELVYYNIGCKEKVDILKGDLNRERRRNFFSNIISPVLIFLLLKFVI